MNKDIKILKKVFPKSYVFSQKESAIVCTSIKPITDHLHFHCVRDVLKSEFKSRFAGLVPLNTDDYSMVTLFLNE